MDLRTLFFRERTRRLTNEALQDASLTDHENRITTLEGASGHTHSNLAILDLITEAFTTALKTAYDGAVSWISANGANVLSHLSNTSNPHNVTAAQVGAITDAGSDGRPYGRKNGAWSQVAEFVHNHDTSYVALLGDQNVAGVKTFSSSPIVPTPTTDFQAATKKYVDDNAGGVTLSQVYPVGSIYIEITGVNPGTTFGIGTWVAFGAGRTLVGVDTGQTEFDAVEETGGAKTHTLDISEIPAHTHTQVAPTSASGGSVRFAADNNASGAVNDDNDTASAGGGGAHNNLQPYITVYFWKRTA